MICYFDTSALVPLLVTEPGTPVATRLWSEAGRVASSELMDVEAAAALAQAVRMGRLDAAAHAIAIDHLDSLVAELHVVRIDPRLIRRAAVLAAELALRAYDALHCASAERIADGSLVVAAGDAALLRACRTLGLGTADTSGEPTVPGPG